VRAAVPVESWVLRWALKGLRQVSQKSERAVVPEPGNSVKAAALAFQQAYFALAQAEMAQE